MKISRKSKHNIPVIFHFCSKWNFNYEIFKPYRDFIREMKYGKNRRCMISKKKCHSIGLQVHHIIPKSIGGINDKSNYVFLTDIEHKTAHKILSRCIEDCGNLIFANKIRQ